MTPFQKIVKYTALALAIFLAISIIGGILSVVGLLSGFFGDDIVSEDVKTYTVSSEIQSLDVSIYVADFTIKQGESFSVESNLKHLTVEDKNGVLTVNEKKGFGSSYNGAILTVYIPEDTVFEKVNISTGAGRLTVDSLSASTMKFDLGAGEVTIDTLVATSNADIDGGAGKITVSGGILHNLDLDMGVGQLNLTSALTGESSFDLGVGQSNITVIGNKENYELDIEKGIGNITVNGTSVSDVKVQGNGGNELEINGGIGDINLKFKEFAAK